MCFVVVCFGEQVIDVVEYFVCLVVDVLCGVFGDLVGQIYGVVVDCGFGELGFDVVMNDCYENVLVVMSEELDGGMVCVLLNCIL